MPSNSAGNAVTNEIMYMANMFGRGQMPYGGSLGSMLQGAANTLNKAGIGTRGIPVTGRERLAKAWGKIPDNLFSSNGGRFAYTTGRGQKGTQPSYEDAQGNTYDAVSGRLLYAANKPLINSRSTGGGSFGGGSPAAERAYQSEKARVAQLTAQDPELQRYEKARAAAKTQEEMNAARDIGMQMWAKANPQLAAKVKPGQSGYDGIQGTLAGNAARAGQGFNMAEQLTPTPQGFPTQIPAFPTGAGYSTGYGIDTNLAPGAQTPPPYSGVKTASEAPGTAATSSFGQPNVMNPEDFQKLLNMVRK